MALKGVYHILNVSIMPIWPVLFLKKWNILFHVAIT